MVYDDGIRTNVFGKEIIFQFYEPPLYSTISVLNYKTQQAKYLINEINNDIHSKSRAIHMNNELQIHYKNEIQDLINKKLIRPSKSPGSPRLVINYKPLNKVLEWIRYPIPNKRNLLKKLYDSKIFSKFDMKSGFWQIQLHEEDNYKTGFNVPSGHFECNVMPFGLINTYSEFQNIMNDIITPISSFAIVYIDDVLIFSKSIGQHFKHLNQFHDLIYQNGLAVSAAKMHLFKNEIHLGIICKLLYNRLKDNPEPWTQKHTNIIKYIKQKVPTLPCLNLPHPNANIIVETDASDIGFGGILKQKFVN
uniref:Reverse transcriptase domain-containing protein n=1 Tax=Lactuca sativa TaxID=4236 RepID=A0A9R1UE50_LACSA|nr:hypothetical protein LSAT_V11C900487890 [Lactuca sativa]